MVLEVLTVLGTGLQICSLRNLSEKIICKSFIEGAAYKRQSSTPLQKIRFCKGF